MKQAKKMTATGSLEVLAGLGLLLWGIGSWSIPAAACVAGILLFVFGLWGRRLL